jgi:hypothetical protein
MEKYNDCIATEEFWAIWLTRSIAILKRRNRIDSELENPDTDNIFCLKQVIEKKKSGKKSGDSYNIYKCTKDIWYCTNNEAMGSSTRIKY